jgi:ABC-2 type transport system permease protein
MSVKKKALVKKGIMMSTQLRTFCALVHRDMAVFWPNWKGRFINSLIWSGLMLLVFEYIMPQMGLKGVGPFMAAGAVASLGFFDVAENAIKFIADLEGNRSISYYLTLPASQSMVFVRLAISNAIQAMSLSIFLLPLYKLILWNSFSFAHFSIGKFILIFVVNNLFFGFFSLYLASVVESMEKVNNMWVRIIYPLWWLGCFQFSWATLNAAVPYISKLSLLNPMTYVMEGMRAAILGQEQFLNFWSCLLAVVIFTILIGLIGIRKLKQRLDCL